MPIVMHGDSPRYKRPRLGRVVAAASVLLTTAVAGAQDNARWYEIELIVFAQSSPDAMHAEAWRQPPRMRPPEDVQELRPSARETDSLAASPFETLPSGALRLHGARKRLQSSQRYEPLLHLGWRQPVRSRGRAAPVHIHTGELTRAQPTTSGQERSAAAGARRFAGDAIQSVTGYDEARNELEETSVETIDGTVQVSVGRYLHVDADLFYRPFARDQLTPAPPDVGFSATVGDVAATVGNVPTQPVTAFRLRESRRMRSNELHYLDHPLFGVLIRITPFEPSVAPPPPEIPTRAPDTG